MREASAPDKNLDAFEIVRAFDLPTETWTKIEGIIGPAANNEQVRFRLLLPVKHYMSASLRGHHTYTDRAKKWTKIHQGALRLDLLLSAEDSFFFAPGELTTIKEDLQRLSAVSKLLQKAMDENAAETDFEPPAKEAAGARKKLVSDLLDIYVASTGRRATGNTPKAPATKYTGEAFAFIWCILTACLSELPAQRTVVSWIKEYSALQDSKNKARV